MRNREYLIILEPGQDAEAYNLLKNRINKKQPALSRAREIKKAIDLLFPKVVIKIIGRDAKRVIKVNDLTR